MACKVCVEKKMENIWHIEESLTMLNGQNNIGSYSKSYYEKHKIRHIDKAIKIMNEKCPECDK